MQNRMEFHNRMKSMDNMKFPNNIDGLKYAKAAFIFAAAVLLVCITCGESYAALSGLGSENEPYSGNAVKGDFFKPDSFIKNLSDKDGSIIHLKSSYEQKKFKIVLDAGDGYFSDGEHRKAVSAGYGDYSEEIIAKVMGASENKPVHDGHILTGWYIKGNRVPADSLSGKSDSADYFQATAGDFGDTVSAPNVRFLIDTDYEEDASAAETDENGAVLIKAMWRTNKNSEPDDKNAAADRKYYDTSDSSDIWDSQNVCNKAIEYLEDCPERDSYIKKHGVTKYQYGRTVLNAETTNASEYKWYIKRRGDAEYSLLAEQSAVCVLSKLKKSDNGMNVRCVVKAGDTEAEEVSDGNCTAEYETKITVLSLPQIINTKITADNKVMNIENT